ncbi:HD-GYP domain-containing protein [Stappia sp.]|jgi:putative nucleotidyltransferase with HDIG domain|uniref:HD-GYP domain-containing protein n=1 Tax=Stappia sp. TaxID=1870903 RepID=UPI003A9A2755
MYDVLILKDATTSADELVRTMAASFTCVVQSLPEFDGTLLGEVRSAVIYSELRRPQDLARISEAIPADWRLANVVYVAPTAERVGVVQAEASGIGRILPSHRSLDDVRAAIRDILNHDLSVRLVSFRSGITKAVKATDTLFNGIGIAMRRRQPLRLDGLFSCSAAINEAVLGDGLATWLNAVQSHHSQTLRHVLNVAGLAASFSNHLGLDDADRALMTEGSLLHDVGKLFIPIAVLEKPGALSDAERALITLHPQRGAEALVQSGVTDPILISAARSHHEYLDGTGYPDKLSGDAINPLVRMLTIIDIYSALTEKRSYKEAMTPRLAIAELAKMKTRLDQRLLAEFRKMILEPAFAASRSLREERARSGCASLRIGLHPLDRGSQPTALRRMGA